MSTVRDPTALQFETAPSPEGPWTVVEDFEGTSATNHGTPAADVSRAERLARFPTWVLEVRREKPKP